MLSCQIHWRKKRTHRHVNVRFVCKYKLIYIFRLKVDPQYLQQIRRDVKTKILPVLLLQLHSLVEEHVGTVCLQI